MGRIVVLTLGLALFVPALATAQQTLPTLRARLPTPSGSQAPAWQQTQPETVTPQTIAAMQKRVADMRALRLQTRNAMLGALSPAHRALLSQIAGELAVSPNPDALGAARRLDAMLTPVEGRAVVTAEQNLRTQMFAEMQTMMPPQMRPRSLASVSTVSSSFPGAQDAGQILLRNAAMGMMSMPNVIFGPGPQLRR